MSPKFAATLAAASFVTGAVFIAPTTIWGCIVCLVVAVPIVAGIGKAPGQPKGGGQ